MPIWLIAKQTHQSGQHIIDQINEQSTQVAFADQISRAIENGNLSEEERLKLVNQSLKAEPGTQVLVIEEVSKDLSSWLNCPDVNLLIISPSPTQVLEAEVAKDSVTESQIFDTLGNFETNIDISVQLKELYPNKVTLLSLDACLQSPQQLHSELAHIDHRLSIEITLEDQSSIQSIISEAIEKSMPSTSEIWGRYQQLSPFAVQVETGSLLKSALQTRAALHQQADYAELSQARVALESLNKLITLELETRNSDLKLATDQIDQAKNDAKLARRQAESYIQEIDALREKVDDYSSENQKNQSQLTLLSELNKEIKHKLLLKEAEVDKLETTYSPIRQYCSELEDKMVLLERAADSHKIEFEKLTANLNESAAQVDRLSMSNQSLAEVNTSLTKQYDAVTSRVTELESEHLNQIQYIEEEKAQLSDLVEQLNVQIIISDEQVKQLHEQLNQKIANLTSKNIVSDIFNVCQSEAVELTSSYDDDGYRDLTLKLFNFTLADGRCFEEFEYKLFDEGGYIGIEIREFANAEGVIDFESSPYEDDYGRHVRFFVNAPEHRLDTQEQVNNSLNGPDRLLILSLIHHCADALCFGDVRTSVEIPAAQLRHWKAVALDLQKESFELPKWFSIGSIEMIEDHQGEDYEHVWIAFNDVLQDRKYFRRIEAKFNARGIHENNKYFASEIGIELRELDGGVAPLEFWPTDSRDEWGNVFNAAITLPSSHIVTESQLSDNDSRLITELIKNYRFWFEKLSYIDLQLNRDIADYLAVGNVISDAQFITDSDNITLNEEHDPVQSETEVVALTNTVSLGGYEHAELVSHPFMVKFQAHDINVETQDARAEIVVSLVDDTESDRFSFEYSEADDREICRITELGLEELNSQQAQLVAEWLNLLKRAIPHPELNNDVWSKITKRLTF